jgi:formylglycine-generating enzyme required for sulfatase activity
MPRRRTHALRLFGIVLAAMLSLMPLTAQAQAPLSRFKDCESCPEMVVLQPGKFLMGASKEDRKLADPYTIESELPQHEVTIGYRFAMGRFEVTVAEFAAYVAETGAKTGGICQLRLPEFGPDRGKFVGTAKPAADDYPPALVTISDGDFRTPGTKVSDQQPATCISRREALGYLDWLGKKSGKAYRLPTEAEWEYAARAGSTAPFYYGGGLKELCKYGNFADSKSVYNARIVAKCAENPSPESTAPVGSYQPNAWGLYDMIGNGFELTEDCASDNYEGAPNDGSPRRAGGACENFATRSYFFDSMGTNLRSAARCTAVGLDDRSNGLTFRAAVSLDDNAWDRKK